MGTEDAILRYIAGRYDPEAVVLYGSYADGTADENSDFDALVIAGRERKHDSSEIDGTVLDVFVYPADTFLSDYDPEEFVQVFGGRIVLDRTGAAGRLMRRVREHVSGMEPKTEDELRRDIAWCEKMLARAFREDAEGYFRLHLLLADSLEIYCGAVKRPYFGPKKSLRSMEQSDPESFAAYSAALREPTRGNLSAWIGRLKTMAYT